MGDDFVGCWVGVESGVDEGGLVVGDGFLTVDAVGVGGDELLEDLSGDVDAMWWGG